MSVLIGTAAITLAACSGNDPDPGRQIGPNPNLPEPIQYFFPPMHLASVVGWKNDEKPTIAQGLQIQAFAHGLQHPRSLYVLPNGDVLVVESKAQWLQGGVRTIQRRPSERRRYRRGD
ncbi:hypothetical protein NKJ40_16865 [Mesorhizobium sp. M0119]|uniref:hypothetical protein n=1 Tax=Mesorhizobium sp. M0119 TaxID=2956885 RepID=UPI00333CE28F